MPLKVLSVAFPFAPVGPRGVGGAEQVLSDLDQALVAAGHTSIVIACEGSETAGTLVPLPSPPVLDTTARAACRRRLQAALKAVITSELPDLVHMHGLDFYEYSVPSDIPVLVTLHLPIPWYPADIWKQLRGPVQFCCVSQSQRASCPARLDDAVVIENGVTMPPASDPRNRKDFALVLGRICPEKNEHDALDAGTRAGIPVVLAGQVFPYHEHERYFDEKIAPRLRDHSAGVQHRFLGPVDSARREQLLSDAKCLLHPTLAPETSSLVAMEALAAGTPVIAYRSGALCEIVDHGVTGFLVDNVSAMADAIGDVHTLSSEACRAAAERRFNKTRMLQRYFELYQSMVVSAQPEVFHAA